MSQTARGERFAFLRNPQSLLPSGLMIAMTLIISAFWTMVLIGGDIFTVSNLAVVNGQGRPQEAFSAGEVVGIERQLCVNHDVAFSFHPGLRSEIGLLFPLPEGLTHMTGGCHRTRYGFIMPPLPPGRYEFVNTISFQNNLIGRDETKVFPPLMVEVR